MSSRDNLLNLNLDWNGYCHECCLTAVLPAPETAFALSTEGNKLRPLIRVMKIEIVSIEIEGLIQVHRFICLHNLNDIEALLISSYGHLSN